PGGPVDDRVDVVGEYPHQVARDTAAGNVREGVYLALGHQVEAGLGVDPGRREQFLAEGALLAEFLAHGVQAHPAGAQEYVAHQGVPVGVQPGRAHRDHRVTRLNSVAPEDLVSLDDPDAGTRDVVLVRLHHARVLGGLAAQQCTAGRPAAVRDT